MNRNGRKYTQFKGINAYLDIVSKNEKLEQLGEIVLSSPSIFNEIKTYLHEIKIDKEWIEKIEFYLPFISAAINEGRRFILNTGETKDIEKIKRVTKDSIVDLAKHSNNIRTINEVTREVEPRKLYIIEKNDDFGLYENRFLVYLILMLNSFVQIRMDKINEARSLVEIETKLNNNVIFFKDSISYSINVSDIRHTNDKIDDNDANKDLLNRLNAIASTIEQFMKSELISIVAKLPLLQEPIQKNNVLKNDPNFVKCYELYEYLKNYTKDGIEINKKELLNTNLSEYYSSILKFIPLMITFLSYSESKNLFPLLKEEYVKEQEEIKANKEELLQKKISEVFNSNGIDKRLICETLIELENKIKEREELINKNKLDFDNKYNDLKTSSRSEIEGLKFEVETYKNKYEKDTATLKEEIETVKKEKDEEIALLNAKISELKGVNRALNIRINPDFEKDLNDVTYFNSLEEDFNAFTIYFKNKWKNVKKVIKKDEKKKIRELLKKKEKLNGK